MAISTKHNVQCTIRGVFKPVTGAPGVLLLMLLLLLLLLLL